MKILGSNITPREVQVWKCLADGMSLKESASHLGCADKTIIEHRRKLKEKLKCNGIAQMTVAAIRYGIIYVSIHDEYA